MTELGQPIPESAQVVGERELRRAWELLPRLPARDRTDEKAVELMKRIVKSHRAATSVIGQMQEQLRLHKLKIRALEREVERRRAREGLVMDRYQYEAKSQAERSRAEAHLLVDAMTDDEVRGAVPLVRDLVAAAGAPPLPSDADPTGHGANPCSE